MMKLYLVRHGKAGDHAESDALRPLTETGKDRTRRSGVVLNHLGVAPAYIFCSPRLRAKQTAEIIGEALGVQPTVDEAVNFDFDVDKLRDLLAHADNNDAEMMFVGHNPGMSDVVSQISGASIHMKTGAIACLQARPAALEHAQLLWLMPTQLSDTLADEKK
jgi:phosphohistidine phosphatase